MQINEAVSESGTTPSAGSDDRLVTVETDPRFTLIVPAYNEAEVVGAVVENLKVHCSAQDWQIIVVNDGSSDDTSNILSAIDGIDVVTHRVNRGYGSAIVSGTRAAKGRFVLWFDADGQHQVDDLIRVADRLVNENLDYCIGIRDRKSHVVQSRRLGKWLLRLTVRIAAGRSVADFNSGLRGFRREIIARYLHLFPKGFGASTTTTLLMLERGYRGAEEIIHVLERQGTSSVRQVRDGLRTLMIILRTILLFKPLVFFGSVGLVLFSFGVAYGLHEALNNRQGFPVLAAILMIFGAQSAFFGLLADQVSAMRRERFDSPN